MGIKWVWTVPNVLSLLRIALIPAFAVLYLMSESQPALIWWAVGALALSGLTDLFDGMIARALNQVSEIGKILDPIADKLTQVTVLICLAVRLPHLWPLVAICFVKEVLQSIGAALLLFRRKSTVEQAQWYGKVSTFVFYFAMAAVVVCPPEPYPPLILDWHMPMWLFIVLVAVVSAFMVYAFVQYMRMYLKITKTADEESVSVTE